MGKVEYFCEEKSKLVKNCWCNLRPRFDTLTDAQEYYAQLKGKGKTVRIIKRTWISNHECNEETVQI